MAPRLRLVEIPGTSARSELLMRRRSLLVVLLLTPLIVLFASCVRGFVESDGEDRGPRVAARTLADRLDLEGSTDPISRVETLSNDHNLVVFCPGMASLRINDDVFDLPGPIIASSRGTLLPAAAEALIRSRLRTPPPPEPKKQTLERRPKQPSRTAWLRQSAPALPPNWNVAANRRWTSIVIHHSATERGGARLFDKMHREQNGWKYGLGYHFVIGNGTDTGDGRIEVGSRWTRQNEGIHGAHAGTDQYNQHGIGICLVGNFEEDRPTSTQMAALLKLVRRLSERYKISPSAIYEHHEVRPEHTDCPGRFFPYRKFLTAVRRPR
ncbi:MAG: peptidoglycan recognition family protein [Planctomycetota bacterium]|nr:peptidoglycan recognition family protein [Planctomycetota bacterium]